MSNHKVDFPLRCDRTAFAERVATDSATHHLKRLAHVDKEGFDTIRLSGDPRHSFVLGVFGHSNLVRRAVSESRSLANQAALPPPSSWLETIGLTQTSFRQQVLDLTTVVLHSVLDRVLLLVNEVYALELEPRKCTLKGLEKTAVSSNQGLMEKLEKLKGIVTEFAGARHSYVHRGEHRKISLFSDLARVRLILETFDVPTEGVHFENQSATESLLDSLRKEVITMDSAAADAMEPLLGPYEDRLESLGGLDRPNREEVQRASSVLQYFAGGERPDFMN